MGEFTLIQCGMFGRLELEEGKRLGPYCLKISGSLFTQYLFTFESSYVRDFNFFFYAFYIPVCVLELILAYLTNKILLDEGGF